MEEEITIPVKTDYSKPLPQNEEDEISSSLMKKTFSIHLIIISVIILGFGIISGWLLFQRFGSQKQDKNNMPQYIQTEKVVGLTDTKTFKDTAEGVIEKGGIDGEGTHKLIREGGPSQTAYLTSSVINLDDYVGKKVKVWGETFKGQKAAWLMDVGKLEILGE